MLEHMRSNPNLHLECFECGRGEFTVTPTSFHCTSCRCEIVTMRLGVRAW